MSDPSRHISDEALILHFYDEDAPGDRAVVEAHRRTCAACAARWRDLVGTLALVSTARPPEPDEGFDRALWTGVARRLDRPARAPWSSGALVWVGSWAAVVALVVAVTYGQRRRVAGSDAPARATAAVSTRPLHARERVLFTALGEQFAETEMLLVELMNEPAASRDEFALEQSMADGLVASGRLYRETARQTGNGQLADVLDDLDNVLVEVARAPATLDAHELQALRARIEDDDLIFKVRAISNHVRDRQQRLIAESE